MAFFDKFKSAIGLEDDYDDEDWVEDDDYGYKDDYVEESRPRYNQETYAPKRKDREREPMAITSSSYSDFANVQISIHEPITYDDAPKVLNDVKQQKIVLLNFEMLEMDKKKQVFEFVAGGIYSLEAQIKKITKDLFVIAPKGVYVEGKSTDAYSENSSFSFNQTSL